MATLMRILLAQPAFVQYFPGRSQIRKSSLNLNHLPNSKLRQELKCKVLCSHFKFACYVWFSLKNSEFFKVYR